jgi:hypothetical protein
MTARTGRLVLSIHGWSHRTLKVGIVSLCWLPLPAWGE